MHIYIVDDDYGETTWIVKSKDLKRFKQEFDWLDDDIIRKYSINNLEDICIAVQGGAGRYSGRVYR
jgi:hypothetical protein